jgi:hypothetical protein
MPRKRWYSKKFVMPCFIDTTSKPAFEHHEMNRMNITTSISITLKLNWGYILIATLFVECVVLS